MATEAGQLVRENLLSRLHKNGWLAEAWVKDVSATQESLALKWTQKGISKMRNLYALLDELGMYSYYKGGELELLHSLTRACVNVHGDGKAGGNPGIKNQDNS